MLATRPRLLVAAIAAALACCTNPQPDAAARELPEPSDLTYGVYLNAAKVGWMRSQVTVGREVEFALELHASVGGMGQVSGVEVTESRSYDARSGLLTRLSFAQEAATGSVRIRGERDGKGMILHITAGDKEQTQRLDAEAETLDDALAAQKLAKSAKVGVAVESRHFDPSLQKSLSLKHRLAAVEPLVLAGVSTKAVRIESSYQEIGITETSWLDDSGKVLETRVGGFFIARLESPDVARRLDFNNDLLVSAVVKPPHPLVDSERLAALNVTFDGMAEAPPPSSPRQQVQRDGDRVLLKLTRDPPLPATSWPMPPAGQAGGAPLPEEARAQLAATPFIQSDAPEIREAAAQATAGAKRFDEAMTKLVSYVYTHIRDEYVPAYSNALEALKSARGDCTEHSILFVALARALGVPARVAVGIAYWEPGGGFGWHAWAEIFAGGRWYAVDPTWNQPVADATHIKLAEGGPAEQARIVMLLGRLHITAMEN